MDDATYSSWILAYANFFQPHFLGPFNESGIKPYHLEIIASAVANGLLYDTLLVGPDTQHVENLDATLATSPRLPSYFDIIGSHNADTDVGATASAWSTLVQASISGAWSSETPAPWSKQNAEGQEIGVSAAVGAGVRGVVLYEAFPNLVNTHGSLTPEGGTMAAGLE